MAIRTHKAPAKSKPAQVANPKGGKDVRKAATPTHTELPRRAQAPIRPGTFQSKNKRVEGSSFGGPTVSAGKEANGRVAHAGTVALKDKQRSATEALASDLKLGIRSLDSVKKSELDTLTATQLHAIAGSKGKGRGSPFVGHTALRKPELVSYLATGVRPAVEKSAPGKGSMEWCKAELRRMAGVTKGFGKYAEIAKAAGLGSISAMKAEALKAFAKKVGVKF